MVFGTTISHPKFWVRGRFQKTKLIDRSWPICINNTKVPGDIFKATLLPYKGLSPALIIAVLWCIFGVLVLKWWWFGNLHPRRNCEFLTSRISGSPTGVISPLTLWKIFPCILDGLMSSLKWMQIRSAARRRTHTWQLIISDGAIRDVSRLRRYIPKFKMKRFLAFPERHLIGFKGVPRVMQIGFKPGSSFDILGYNYRRRSRKSRAKIASFFGLFRWQEMPDWYTANRRESARFSARSSIFSDWHASSGRRLQPPAFMDLVRGINWCACCIVKLE